MHRNYFLSFNTRELSNMEIKKKNKKITLSVGIQCKIGDSRGTDDMPLGSDSENTVGYMHETLS